jgi:hypothetical protein
MKLNMLYTRQSIQIDKNHNESCTMYQQVYMGNVNINAQVKYIIYNIKILYDFKMIIHVFGKYSKNILIGK